VRTHSQSHRIVQATHQEVVSTVPMIGKLLIIFVSSQLCVFRSGVEFKFTDVLNSETVN
jgi:hypothetical protein